jgi:hypothetical protein
MSSHHILILGASYGSLLASKLVLAGHHVTLVCLAEEAALINREGTRVRIPVRGREGTLTVDSRDAAGRLAAATPAAVDPDAFALVALAMQEPQYRAPEVRALLEATARARVPCMSIMNMPPLPYLARLPGVDCATLRDCYTDATVWDAFDPGAFTLASPDPQAFRPLDEPLNVLQVSLPTNFKVARFEAEEDTALLHRLEADIQAVRLPVDGEGVELPVKLRVHDSIYVPLAKWCMLIAGNYRCVQDDGPVTIRDAVHADLSRSRTVYEWVAELCRRIGASAGDLVPFEKYAAAAEGLGKPSSAARALFAGAPHIERVDRVVQRLAAQKGLVNEELDAIVARVDARLARNREAAA